jgi:hypothetical protein
VRVRRSRWLLIGLGTVVVLVIAALIVIRHYHLTQRGRTTTVSVDEARRRYEQSTAPAAAITAAVVAGPTSSSAAPASTVPNTPTTTARSTPLAPTGTSVPATAPAEPVSSPPATSPPAVTSSAAPPPVDTAAPSTTAGAAPRLPAPGVYVYTTTGRDSVDALNGDHHDYPDSTTITVQPAGCGISARWAVAEQRWDEWQRCVTADGITQPASRSYHEFFGQGDDESVTCTGDARPVDAPAGTTWTQNCVQAGDPEVHHGVVVGSEVQTVGGAQVSTLHVRVTITDDVAADDQVTDTWYETGTDLVVAQSAQNDTTSSSPVGDVHYHEQYSIHLDSTAPLT